LNAKKTRHAANTKGALNQDIRIKNQEDVVFFLPLHRVARDSESFVRVDVVLRT